MNGSLSGGLPACPACGAEVMTALSTGENHPETYRLLPCGDSLTSRHAVDTYSREVLRSLGYQVPGE